jgi:integrase/recombinase XerD
MAEISPLSDDPTTTTIEPPTITEAWIAAFLDHGIYLRGWSPATCRTYRQGLATLATVPLTKTGLIAWMRTRQQRGLTPGGINMFARSINSFLSFALGEGLISERLRIRLLPDPPKPLTPISDQEIRRLLVFRPKGRAQTRMWTLVLLLLDTGLQLSEALTLTRDHVDLHNCLIRVRGKGNRERLVPISLECRKQLFLLPKSATAEHVFATRSGPDDAAQQLPCDQNPVSCCGCTGAHVHPHAFRHCFAVTYIRRGGDLYRLSRLLGHASVTATQRYLRSMGADTISEGHQRLSPLSRTVGREAPFRGQDAIEHRLPTSRCLITESRSGDRCNHASEPRSPKHVNDARHRKPDASSVLEIERRRWPAWSGRLELGSNLHEHSGEFNRAQSNGRNNHRRRLQNRTVIAHG